MTTWGVIVCLAAIAGIQVSAERFAFIENVQSPAGSRIVSGWEAEEGQIPWQLSLRMVGPDGGVSSCGGSIIHPEWGMTAAHCTATRVTMVLRAGAVSLTRPELIFETTEYYNHPLYIDALQSIVQPHDIALLKFGRSITFSDRVQPVRLQPSSEMNRNYNSVRLVASGWGRTWTNGASPENLQWVYLVGDSNEHCWNTFGGSSIIVDSTICASYYNVTSQSTCQGDSGGPLVELEEDGKYTMVGVTSFVSSSGCHAGFPAGFIRPGHYHAWFTDVTGIDFDWEAEETTETPTTTEADSSSESSEESSESDEQSSESDEESEETTTTAATTEEATTEASTTDAGTDTTTQETTTEGDTDTSTTEPATTEAETEATTDAGTDSTTEAEIEATTTDAATTEAETEATEATTEAETEATTDAGTDATTEAEIENTTTDAATTEAGTEATEGTTEEASAEEATTQEATTEAATEAPEEEYRSYFSYFRMWF